MEVNHHLEKMVVNLLDDDQPLRNFKKKWVQLVNPPTGPKK